MFNIGGGEFLVIALIALIVLGPQRLPDAARQVGKALGELRRMSTGFQNEIKDAFSDPELSAAPAPRRHALKAPAETAPTAAPNMTSSAVTNAVAAVSQQPVARRAPLKAAPATKASGKASGTASSASSTPAAGAKKAAPAKQAAPAKKAASAKSAPRAKAPRLPSGG